MDISFVKEHLFFLEQQKKRMPVYRYLKELWNTPSRTEDLTVLIMQQMMFYLIELESPWVTWETEDEHQTYQSFLHEALAYGLEVFSHEKKFMWNLCFFLEASSVYHCIFGDQIPIGSENILKKKLYEEAKNRYPTSVMFDVIPLIQGGDPLWRDKISDDAKKTLIAEVNEWNLMTNMVDEDLQELLCVTEEKSNRNDGVRDLPPSSISLCEKYMKSRTKLFLALCIAGIVIVVTLCVYQNNSRSNIDRLNQAILQSPALESASYDVELLMSSLSDSVRNAIVEVVPVHNAFDTHTGTWIVTQKGFATKRGIFLSTELLAEIPKSQNFGIAIEPLGNVNGVYSYLLEYYWD